MEEPQDIQELKGMLEAENHLNEKLCVKVSEIKEKLSHELEEVKMLEGCLRRKGR